MTKAARGYRDALCIIVGGSTFTGYNVARGYPNWHEGLLHGGLIFLVALLPALALVGFGWRRDRAVARGKQLSFQAGRSAALIRPRRP